MKLISKLSISVMSVVLGLSFSTLAEAQTAKKKVVQRQKPAFVNTRKAGPKIYTTTTNSSARNQISQALGLFKSGQYAQASNAFLALSRRGDLASERPQTKYYLGLALMEQSLNQVAAFQFVDVIRSGDQRWTRQAIEKLLIVTDRLGDETLLNFAIQRIDVSQVPTQHRDMLFYRLGEIKYKAGLFQEAATLYGKVGSQSRYFYNALYGKGLSYAEANQTELALQTFQKLREMRETAKVTDMNRVSADMAIARVYYQKQNWDKAIESYAKIPRDHVMWHQAMFEKTWAMLRAARFRSTLSNFQTLHSTYYEDAYIPETLLLRSIVYLYICKYDEMEKVLGLFESQYGPINTKINQFLNQQSSAEAYFQEVNKAFIVKKDADAKKNFSIPYNAMKHVAEEGDVRRMYNYLKKIGDEKKTIEENPNLKNTAIGSYSIRIINNRAHSARNLIGDMAKAHLMNMRVELKDLHEQSSFIRYEMINGKKEFLKKKLSGRALNEEQVDENQDRSFYVQNGYEYYPFQGEYWLDEVGNYHYLGKQSCE